METPQHCQLENLGDIAKISIDISLWLLIERGEKRDKEVKKALKDWLWEQDIFWYYNVLCSILTHLYSTDEGRRGQQWKTHVHPAVHNQPNAAHESTQDATVWKEYVELFALNKTENQPTKI